MTNNIIISYLKLSKALLSFAVSISALIGYFISKNVDFNSGLILFFGVFFLSSAASAINQIQEHKSDILMKRTKNRPIPAKLITINNAIIYSVFSLLIGSLLLLKLNLFCFLLGLLNVIIYNLIYTPLKYKSQFALIAGGLVGAIPPIIGWSASELNLSHEIIFFSTFMFLWQIPHFWILLLKYKNDYGKVNIKNITNNINNNKLKLVIFIWILATSILTLTFPLFGIITGSFQTIALIILNTFLILSFIKLLFTNDETYQYKMANVSTHLYLILMFVVIVFDKL